MQENKQFPDSVPAPCPVGPCRNRNPHGVLGVSSLICGPGEPRDRDQIGIRPLRGPFLFFFLLICGFVRARGKSPGRGTQTNAAVAR